MSDIIPVAYSPEQSKFLRNLAKKKGVSLSEAMRICVRQAMGSEIPWWQPVVEQLFKEHNEIKAELQQLREAQRIL